MEPLIVRNSRWLFGLLGFFFLALALGSAALLLLDDSEARLMGLGGLVFFGGMVVFAAVQLFRRRPRMVLNDEGINDYNLKMGVIPWSEITQAYVLPLLWYKNVELKLRNPDVYRKKQPGYLQALASYNSAFGMSPFVLYMSNTNTKAQTVVDYINRQLLTQWPAPAPPPPPAAHPRPAGGEEGEY
ncbi:STM3941 family protein [Hymenobacter ruricola]|uniref:PH domain-containing protein n=1 Tax=Hymenobacter ruricola TaxID=2791023 RepID=A0ABS0I299_9BACT|nr:STM3941 family protein [Hymenobacter ruricola]MBF9221032.1 hypothetical protein [Hymenobacter ruricola]